MVLTFCVGGQTRNKQVNNRTLTSATQRVKQPRGMGRVVLHEWLGKTSPERCHLEGVKEHDTMWLPGEGCSSRGHGKHGGPEKELRAERT